VAAVQKAARFTADWIDLQWSSIDILLKRVATRARGRLLDVGCGDKPYEHIFRPYVSEYLGIEHEATFLHTAASTKAGKPDMVYDGKTLPFPDRSFDTVLNVQVLEHTPHPGALVHEMSRVLKDDGRLILSAPFQFRLHEQPHDYFRYTPHGLRALCADAGLEVEELHAQRSMWSVIAHKINSYLALRVANAGQIAQMLDKLPHERPTDGATRYWTLPFVAPTMLGISVAGRVMDRVAFEPEEAMGYLIIARRAAHAST
jgi:SAM-dependent methyltransferase